MTFTLGGLLLLLLVVALVVISYKVREHSRKIKELEGTSKK
ncbi:unnamed protein product [marine sediment metagenome]|uniref:Uncharacterized protein n=1 Tax=marine sediment metagenome TaxID=412755 RepID=X1BHE1_9ZZZZ